MKPDEAAQLSANIKYGTESAELKEIASKAQNLFSSMAEDLKALKKYQEEQYRLGIVDSDGNYTSKYLDLCKPVHLEASVSCPYCLSTNVNVQADVPNWPPPYRHYTCICHGCGRSWKYDFSPLTDIKEPI